MNPHVSIIIPVFKAGEFLHKCIESVRGQTFKDFEVILIDDGSPDNSGEICDKAAAGDLRFRVIHKANGGVSSARNRGLDAATGEWIVFVDADDWLDPEYLAAFMEPPNLRADILLFQGYRKVFADSISEFCLTPYGKSEETIVKNNLFSHWGICGKLYNRRKIEERHLRFDEALSLGEDTIFFFRYLSGVEELRVLARAGYNYRNSDVSLSKKKTPWAVHHAGSVAITEAALPVARRLVRGNFFYRKRFQNLLIYEQHALRLETLYRGGLDGRARLRALKEAFGSRIGLLKTAYPLFSKKWKYSLLWLMFVFLPISLCDRLLSRIFRTVQLQNPG